MCTGRLDLAHVLRAFAKGADGVSIAGCHINECNYTTHGNFHALSMVALARRLLEHVGLDPDRLRMDLVSSGEGNRFAEVMNEFGRTIRELGPLGDNEGVDAYDLPDRLGEIIALVPFIKIVMREKLTQRLDTQEAYDELYTLAEIEHMLDEVVSYYIEPEKCQGCMTCYRHCPVEAIVGARKVFHVIDQEACIRCGTCLAVCPPRYDAVMKLVGEPAPPPIPEDQRAISRKAVTVEAGSAEGGEE
jgi:coenzyme F420-reducing hydrogenase delta subunit/Fe-S-cluster-containing hydrogenase component 2